MSTVSKRTNIKHTVNVKSPRINKIVLKKVSRVGRFYGGTHTRLFVLPVAVCFEPIGSVELYGGAADHLNATLLIFCSEWTYSTVHLRRMDEEMRSPGDENWENHIQAHFISTRCPEASAGGSTHIRPDLVDLQVFTYPDRIFLYVGGLFRARSPRSLPFAASDKEMSQSM